MCSTFPIAGNEVEQGFFLVVVDLCQEGHKVSFRGVLVKGRVVGSLVLGLDGDGQEAARHELVVHDHAGCPAVAVRERVDAHKLSVRPCGKLYGGHLLPVGGHVRKEEPDLLEHVVWFRRAMRCADDAHGVGTVDAALQDVLHQDFVDVLHEFFIQRAAFSDELADVGKGAVVVRDLVHLAEFLAANGNAVLEQHFRFHKGKRVAFDLRGVVGIRHVEVAVVVVEHVRRQCAGDAGHIGLESVKGLVVEVGHGRVLVLSSGIMEYALVFLIAVGLLVGGLFFCLISAWAVSFIWFLAGREGLVA